MLAGQTDHGAQSGDAGTGALARGPWAVPDGSTREAHFQAEVNALAQRLASTSARDQAGGIDDALHLFVSGLGASAAAFYTPASTSLPGASPRSAGSTRFTLGQSRDESALTDRVHAARPALPEELDIERLPERGDALWAGEARRICWPQSGLRTRTLGAAKWESIQRLAHVLLLVPCVGPEGLLGVFAASGGLASQRGNESILSSATLLGTVFASFLERNRLETQLDALRKTSAQGDRLETLGRVAISVAHDFNNVLTAIGGNAEMLEMTLPEDAKGLEEVHEIAEASARAAELVEEVLSFGRAREERVRRVNLAELVSQLGPIMRRVAGNGMDVRIDLGSDLPSVELHPGRFERALLNLASNARDAQPENRPRAGVLALSAKSVRVNKPGRGEEAELAPFTSAFPVPLELQMGDYLCLRVEDDGCGMDPKIQEKAFEPFFTTKGEGRGTGLGLATCSEVMRELGGAVAIDSAPGEGTAFDLYFPIAL